MRRHFTLKTLKGGDCMKLFRGVRGTQEKVADLEVNIDTVYVRDNITRIETDEFTGWQYDEFQYSLREYQEAVGNKTLALTEDVNIVADLTIITALDKDELAETLVFALQRIDELEGKING